MVKIYLRYAPSIVTGIIASASSNSIFANNKEPNLVCTAALEYLAIWNIQSGQLISLLTSEKHDSITYLCSSSSLNKQQLIAVGYQNGSIGLFDLDCQEMLVTFQGHSLSISALCFSNHGPILVSGSRDKDIIVWDCISQCGQYRFKGHQHEVTRVQLINHDKLLISISRDTLIKVWSLDFQYCIQTIVMPFELTALVINKEESLLFIGGNDRQISIFDIYTSSSISLQSNPDNNQDIDSSSINNQTNNIDTILINQTLIQRQHSSHSVISLSISPRGDLLMVQTKDKILEFFKILSDEEFSLLLLFSYNYSKMRRRKRALRESSQNIIPSSLHLKTSSSIRYASFSSNIDNQISILISSAHNSLSLYTFDNSSSSFYLSSLIDYGHHHTVNSICYSHHNFWIASASLQQIKIWDATNGNHVLSLSSVPVSKLFFVPGDQYLLSICRDGQIIIYDISSALSIFSLSAHSSIVYAADLHPTSMTLATGGQDKEIKFWKFHSIISSLPTTSHSIQITFSHQLSVDDEIFCLKYSHSLLYIAVSLANNIISVYYHDSLRLYLNLYGHSLPCHSIDISDDQILLLSGSLDKTIRVWGLDFGDCHHIFSGPVEGVTQVIFIPKSHRFFCSSKNGSLYYYDADVNQHLSTLSIHHSSIECFSINQMGDQLVTSGSDRSIRIWQQTVDQFTADEEADSRLTTLLDEEIIESPPSLTLPSLSHSETGKPTLPTSQTGREVDKIYEVLELLYQQEQKSFEYQNSLSVSEEHATFLNHYHLSTIDETQPILPGPVHPLFPSGSDYLLHLILQVPSSLLDEVFLSISFNHAIQLLKYLFLYLDQSPHTELLSRCILLLVKIHSLPLIHQQSLLPFFIKLKENLKTSLRSLD